MNTAFSLIVTRCFLAFVSLVVLISAGQAQIPGFVEKWTVPLHSASSTYIFGMGRDGSVVAEVRCSPITDSKLYWISSDGVMVTRIDWSELDNPVVTDGLIMVLVLNSNLVIQSWNNYSSTNMQIMQITRGNGSVTTTKTTLTANLVNNRSQLSDYSCPERLMFFQRGNVLECYRPNADINPNFKLTMRGVSGTGAEILINSAEPRVLALQGSTNISDWHTVTNVSISRGVTEVLVPALHPERFFYRGVGSAP
jgi:hypothetical protein